MPDTTTSLYGLTKPEDGQSEDTWGVKLNADLDALDALLNQRQRSMTHHGDASANPSITHNAATVSGGFYRLDQAGAVAFSGAAELTNNNRFVHSRLFVKSTGNFILAISGAAGWTDVAVHTRAANGDATDSSNSPFNFVLGAGTSALLDVFAFRDNAGNKYLVVNIEANGLAINL